MEIREINIADLTQIEKLCRTACKQEAMVFYSNIVQTLHCSWIKGFVALDAEGIAGYISVSFAEWYGKRAHIVDFVLRPGINAGKQLIAFVWEILQKQDFKRVTCVTKSGNTEMMNILNKMGWKAEAVLDKYDPAGKRRVQYVRFVEEGYMK